MNSELDQKLVDFAKKIGVSIKQKLKVNKIFLVRVDTGNTIQYGDESLDRNIYAFNESGEQIWQIEPAPIRQSPNPYMSLRTEEGKIIAETWTGVELSINLSDGSVMVSTHNIRQRPW